MRKTLVLLGAGIALIGAACGGDTIAEKILENEIGGDVDINIDGDGDTPEINIETDEGSISIGGGSVPDELTEYSQDGPHDLLKIYNLYAGGRFHFRLLTLTEDGKVSLPSSEFSFYTKPNRSLVSYRHLLERAELYGM